MLCLKKGVIGKFKSKAWPDSGERFDSNQRLGRIPANASIPIKGLAGFRRTLRFQSKAWPDSAQRFDSSQRLAQNLLKASTPVKGSRRICSKLRLQSKARAEFAQSFDSDQRLAQNPRKVLIPFVCQKDFGEGTGSFEYFLKSFSWRYEEKPLSLRRKSTISNKILLL